MKTKKAVMVVAVISVFVISQMLMGNVVFAADDYEGEQEVLPTEDEYLITEDNQDVEVGDGWGRTILYSNARFERVSNTKAQAIVRATGNRSKITSTVYLQKKNSSTGTYSNVKGVLSTKNSSNGSISHAPLFSISKNHNYRIKIVVSDANDTIAFYKVLS